MRPILALACVSIVVAVAQVSGAAAAGPIFTVVPTAGDGGSLHRAIEDRLRDERLALARLRKTQHARIALLRRTRSKLAGTGDPFPAEDEAVRLDAAIRAGAQSIRRVQTAIRGLQLALRPVSLPPNFASQSPSAIGAYIVTIAERYLGVRYLWGGNNPDDGFDCSGFVQYVYAQIGVKLPHYAATQYAKTQHIDGSEVEPGDLVFFEPRADGPGHVGIYVGDGIFIEAPHTGDVVKFESVADEAALVGYVGATRPVA